MGFYVDIMVFDDVEVVDVVDFVDVVQFGEYFGWGYVFVVDGDDVVFVVGQFDVGWGVWCVFWGSGLFLYVFFVFGLGIFQYVVFVGDMQEVGVY